MFVSIIQFFYPDIKKEEVAKFGLFALALFFILGSYWTLRLLKDALIYGRIAFPIALGWESDYGLRLIPKLKLMTPFVVAGVVIIYTKLCDMFDKHKLFYIFCSFYSLLFTLAAITLYCNDTFGSESIGKYPLAALGVVLYLAIESFGSLIVALFWSFAISSSKTEDAKRSFPFILAVAQIGTIGGSAIAVTGLTPWKLFALCAVTTALVMVAINRIVTIIPASQLVSDKVEKKHKADILAGIKLLVSQPYLLGVFVISTFYEIVKAITDYQMKCQLTFIPGMDFMVMNAWFAFWMNILTFTMALLGTSYIMKTYGLRVCAMLYPIVFAIASTSLYIYYLSNPSPLNLYWATFYVMVVVTATSYAVNNPTKEMMYIPTSNDAKFKVKSITDAVGSRGSKAIGSNIIGSFNVPGNQALTLANMMGFGTLIGLGFISIWLVAAFYVGNKNAQLIRDNQIIE